MQISGTVFRAHNPRWSWSPLSGDGAAKFGGRFNPIGTPALYTSVRASTALLEASPLGRPFQPLTLISYQIEVELMDATDPAVLSTLGVGVDDLAYPDWEFDMLNGRTPPQHRLAQQLIGQGAQGLRVPSFARGAEPSDINIVFWAWDDRGGADAASVKVVDDEGRLPRDAASWAAPET